MNSNINYHEATEIYRNLPTTEGKNRKVKVAAIKRAIDKLSNAGDGNLNRSELDLLPRLVLTYTRITHLNETDFKILKDLQRYLSGEVGA